MPHEAADQGGENGRDVIHRYSHREGRLQLLRGCDLVSVGSQGDAAEENQVVDAVQNV